MTASHVHIEREPGIASARAEVMGVALPPVDGLARWAMFALAWGLSVAYIASWIRHGWIPHDDGLLAQSATRLMQGQLPHRDFVDLYTGGLTALNALAFTVFGIRLLSIRIMLLIAASIWVAIVYAVARRFVPPLIAAVATFAAVAWGVPNYPAAMPSWYNLFAATAGLLALLKYSESQRVRWLVGAGVLGGLSILFKIVGLYFLGAAFAFVVYTAYDPAGGAGRAGADGVAPSPAGEPSSPQARREWLFERGIACATAAILVAAVIALVHFAATPGTYLFLVLPTAAVSAALVAGTWQGRLSRERLWRGCAALAAGVAIAIVPYIAIYALGHGLGAMYNGIFVLPARRFKFAVATPTWPDWKLFAIAGALVLFLLVRPIWVGELVVIAILAMLGGLHITAYWTRYNVRMMQVSPVVLPLLSVAFAGLTAIRAGPPMSVQRKQQVFAVVAVAALCALVDFPFFAWIYFYYYASLVILAALAVYAQFGRPGGKLIGTAALVVCIPFVMARMPARSSTGSPMVVPRGGLLVPAFDSAESRGMVDSLRAHAHNGYLFATPDCPEVYFLTGLKNPTRTMFDFFDDTTGRTPRLLRMVDSLQISAVAINRWAAFSGPPDPTLLAGLMSRFPDTVRVGRYTLMWHR